MARPIDPEIIRFIIDQVEARPGDIAPLTARRFGVTRATASNYLRRLVREGRLLAHGRTRARSYVLKPVLLMSGIARLQPDTEDDEIWRRELRPRLEGLPRAVIDVCHYGFTAAVANAVEHSGGASFTWSLRMNARSVELAVSDDGVGVFAKLRAGLGLEDDRRALLELAKGGATTDPRRHGGAGLFFASHMFDGFRLASGRLAYLRSGVGEGRRRAWTELLAPPMTGTLVAMRLDMAAARPPADVFTRFTGEGGRPDAEVPASLAAPPGEPLTSRSEAKRLTAGLERFGEVTLDFDGAKGVGPAFIHEIFAVFARAHPDTRLKAVCAAPEVAEMIAQARTG